MTFGMRRYAQRPSTESFLRTLIYQKGLHLITESTPNGKKVQILLEELREAYGLHFTTTLIDIDTNEQKQDWFLRLNLNGRIPVIVDNDVSPPHPVMESTAELL